MELDILDAGVTDFKCVISLYPLAATLVTYHNRSIDGCPRKRLVRSHSPYLPSAGVGVALVNVFGRCVASVVRATRPATAST